MPKTPVQKTCNYCDGKGKVPVYQTQGEYENTTDIFDCSQCKGKGWVSKWSGGIKTCPSCSGEKTERRQATTIFGHPKEENCYKCGGKGWLVEWKED